MMPVIAPIVEGHGDSLAIRRLIERVTSAYCADATVVVAKPLRMQRAVTLAARQIRDRDGGVLVLIDADDDCPRELAPALLAHARAAHGGVAVEVVLAEREFEAWGLAAARSLRGWRGLPDDLEPPPNPQGVRGAKEWLTERMPGAAVYSPTADQPSLAAAINLDQARSLRRSTNSAAPPARL